MVTGGLVAQAQCSIEQEFQWNDNYDVTYLIANKITSKYVIGTSESTKKKHKYNIKYVLKDTRLELDTEFAVVTDPSDSDKILAILEVSVD